MILLLPKFSFAFKIDELKFGKILEPNKKTNKVFTLTNNENNAILYEISIEGDSNVKAIPSLLRLLPQQSKKFTLEIIANNLKGDYNYFLVIKEIKKEKLSQGIDLNKIVKIKQAYTIK